jgi:hypothetical protein
MKIGDIQRIDTKNDFEHFYRDFFTVFIYDYE